MAKTVRIPDDIYLKLAEESEKLSWSISQLLRVILTNEFSFSVEQKVESEIDKETEHKLLNDRSHRSSRLTFLANESLKEAVEKLAQDNKTTLSRQIYVLLKNSLLKKQYILNDREIEILNENNYELRAIGRNLNQIVHMMHNVRSKELDDLKLGFIKNIMNKIEESSALIRQKLLSS